MLKRGNTPTKWPVAWENSGRNWDWRQWEKLFATLALLASYIEEIRIALVRIVKTDGIEGLPSGLQRLVEADNGVNAQNLLGKFWTELGLETMGKAFCDPARKQVMLEAGVRYGCGLQLVNILRDCAEDAARGRCYLCSSRSAWLGRAERYLRDGVDYSTRLRGFRLRFASMLPALIGLRTIQLLRQKPEGERVKVPRRTVYACMLQAMWLSSVQRAS